MPFFKIHGDITTLKVDAIVNAANSTLLGGGGVDGAIHAAAGPELFDECKTLGGCNTGEAKITKGYNLPAKYVIHTVGPIWNDGFSGENILLKSCYLNSLKLAKENNIESIAFPLISSGVYGYPQNAAIKVAEAAILNFLEDNDMTVYLVFYDKDKRLTSSLEYELIRRYIRTTMLPRYNSRSMYRECNHVSAFVEEDIRFSLPYDEPRDKIDLKRDESFSQMMFRLIDQMGISDVEFYKKANISKKVFSKARNIDYQPCKITAIAFALALELDRKDFDLFLKKAGFALSDHITFDLIISYCIENKIYNIFKVNDILYDFDQVSIGQ